MSRESLATAASTAAISSGSGGSGMYSLAPAWMAATAARASLPTPQATIGAAIRSASSRSTRSRMSSATSTISRSAPRPERNTLSACSIDSAWVTLAPLSIASLVAVVSWPFKVPTIRRRMASFLSASLHLSPRAGRGRKRRRASTALRLDDFGHGHAELVLDQHHLAAAELEQLADLHARAPEHRRHLHRHVEHRLEIGGPVDRGFGPRIGGLRIQVRRRRHLAGFFQVGQRQLALGIAHRSNLQGPSCM